MSGIGNKKHRKAVESASSAVVDALKRGVAGDELGLVVLNKLAEHGIKVAEGASSATVRLSKPDANGVFSMHIIGTEVGECVDVEFQLKLCGLA